jgi:thioesterase domain-containing protein
VTGETSFVCVRAAQLPQVHLIHPGAGDSHSYTALIAAMPLNWSVTASEDRGQAETVAEMARLYQAELLRHVGVPDVIGGWSLGGLVAFELIRTLRQGGAGRLPRLFLIDSPPPGGRGDAFWNPANVISEFGALIWNGLDLPGQPPDSAGDDEAGALRTLAAALGDAAIAIDTGWLADQLAEYRRHRAAVAGYSCDEPLSVPALLVVGDLPDSHIASWQAVLPPDTVITRLAGGHFDLLRPPLVVAVASLLADLVARADMPRQMRA